MNPIPDPACGSMTEGDLGGRLRDSLRSTRTKPCGRSDVTVA